MKIALLADIHGNLQALEAVIDAVEKEGVDYFIVAGDSITDCSRPNEVLEVVSKLKGWVIKGNRETMILENLTQGSQSDIYQDQYASMAWTLQTLSEENITYIASLQDQIVAQIQGKDEIRVVHGSPHDPYEHLYPHQVEKLKKMVMEMREKVLICGHTHEQWVLEVDKKLIVNPGSVGLAFHEGCFAEYAILHWETDRWLPSLHKIKYSVRDLVEDFHMQGLFEHGGIWPKLIIQSLLEGKNKNLEFIRDAKAFMTQKALASDLGIPNDVWEIITRRYEFFF